MLSITPSMDRSSFDIRRRSLLSDVCRGLQQQMIFWGCDIRQGGVPVRLGFEKLPRRDAAGEGSSRYRLHSAEGILEIHSFCAGWYPRNGEGVVFIRQAQRVFVCTSGKPVEPGHYGDRLRAQSPDRILEMVRPLVRSVADYETLVMAAMSPAYRAACWRLAAGRQGFRPWLRPEQAVDWFEGFLADPAQVPRPRCRDTSSGSLSGRNLRYRGGKRRAGI